MKISDTISIIAVVVSVFSLGWNFFRDIIVLAKLHIDIDLAEGMVNIQNRTSDEARKVVMKVVNTSLVPISIYYVIYKKHKWDKTFSYGEPETPGRLEFPIILQPGDIKQIIFPFTPPNHEIPNWFLDNEKSKLIGLYSSFNRINWASKKQFSNIRKKYKEYRKKSDEC